VWNLTEGEMWRNERQGLILVYCDERKREGVIRGGGGGRGSGESRKENRKSLCGVIQC
jgi:hypothetical protein